MVRKLDLACGQTPRPGFEGVDLWPGAQHVVDLQRFPWPFETSSIDEVWCAHYCEHIPAQFVDARGDYVRPSEGKDGLFAFFDELWRILAPDATATIVVPNARSNRAFQDPTHRRYFVAETFQYLLAPWRAKNQLDHYRVTCNFDCRVGSYVTPELATLREEDQQHAALHNWNVILDWQVTLRAIK